MSRVAGASVIEVLITASKRPETKNSLLILVDPFLFREIKAILFDKFLRD